MVKKSIKKKISVFKGESNPFNMKVNRSKHTVINQRLKGTIGRPLLSRAVSHSRRRDLWQKSKVTATKANHFVDKRLMDGSTPLEMATSRLVLERKRKLSKSIFNLNDDEEELTHKGVPVQTIKRFDNEASDEEEDNKQLDAGFVKRAHFGGFVTDNPAPKSHKEIMDQFIAESKQKKYEQKAEREKTVDLTEQLDKDWRELHSVMSGIKMGRQTEDLDKKDAYDVITQELKFALRGSAVVPEKTPEQVALEEEEKQKQLEEDRRRRMVDDAEIKAKKSNNHLSADSILDDFYLQPVGADETTPMENDKSENGSDESDTGSNSGYPEVQADSDDDDVESMDEEKEKLKFDSEASMSAITSTDNNNTSDIPQTLSAFLDIVENSTDDIYDVVEIILKRNIKSKSERIKLRLSEFFAVLMQYTMEQDSPANLLPHLHAIAEASPLNTAETFLAYLDQEQELFEECKGKKMKNFPRLKTLLLLKYSTALYSVSDFRHPVVTPAFLFMCDILSSPYNSTLQNVTNRLFVSSLLLSSVSQSRRFVPDALLYLNKVLNHATACPKNENKFNLILGEKSIICDIPELDLLQDRGTKLNNAIKLSVISECIKQLNSYSDLYTELPSYTEIFSPILTTCSKISVKHYPQTLATSLDHFMEKCNRENPIRTLTYANTKPKPLKLFEPRFDSKYNRGDDIDRKRKLIKSVAQKIRKEEKGMLREMRRDAQMIAAEKLKETLENDAERKRKVKELYAELANQEGDYKKMMKKL